MENDNKTRNIIDIPLFNIWYVIFTLIFILMQITNIIDWSPLWILSPLWIPIALALSIFVVLVIIKFILIGIINIVDFISLLIRRKGNE